MKIIFAMVLLVVLFLIGGGFYMASEPAATKDFTPPPPDPIESQAPPATPPNSETASGMDPKSGITFTYPIDLGTSYVTANSWPPLFISSPGAYNCAIDEQTAAMSGFASREATYAGTTYCLWERVEGAAGTEYTDYQITFPKDNQFVTMSFALGRVECKNYPEPEALQCQQEQASFNLLALVDSIAQTVAIPTN